MATSKYYEKECANGVDGSDKHSRMSVVVVERCVLVHPGVPRTNEQVSTSWVPTSQRRLKRSRPTNAAARPGYGHCGGGHVMR